MTVLAAVPVHVHAGHTHNVTEVAEPANYFHQIRAQPQCERWINASAESLDRSERIESHAMPIDVIAIVAIRLIYRFERQMKCGDVFAHGFQRADCVLLMVLVVWLVRKGRTSHDNVRARVSLKRDR